MKILVIQGPNLNTLGKRKTNLYGSLTMSTLHDRLSEIASVCGADVLFFQSNCEGSIIDFIQKMSSDASGILINPGALTHYGYSLRDALEDTKLPIVEVHLSDITKRESFRRVDVLTGIVRRRFMGEKEESYLKGLLLLIKIVKDIHE
jgi:3-dehydroquinate dehydratase II